MNAARSGSLELVKALVEAGASIDQQKRGERRKGLGETALMRAAKYGHADIVEYLAGMGADVNAQNYKENTALILTRSPEVTRVLLDSGARINDSNRSGLTALMDAARSGSLETVKVLVEAGARVDQRPQYNDGTQGRTALLEAARNGQAGVVEYLAGIGADVNTKYSTEMGSQENEYSALMLASVRGDVDTVNVLLQAGAKVNAKDSHDRTALIMASQEGHADVVEVLLGAGADANMKSKAGMTALLATAKYGSGPDVARVLIENGAKVNAKDGNWFSGKTVLEIAEEKGDVGLVRLLESDLEKTDLSYASKGGNLENVETLIEQGADVNEADDQGYTALMKAAQEGRVDVVETLLESGADVSARANSFDKETALLVAAKHGHTDVVRVLIEKGKADVNVTTRGFYSKGDTALDIALQEGNINTAELLQSHGAKKSRVPRHDD